MSVRLVLNSSCAKRSAVSIFFVRSGICASSPSISRLLSAISRRMFSRASRTNPRLWNDSRTPSSDSAMRTPAVIVTRCSQKSFQLWMPPCGAWMSTIGSRSGELFDALGEQVAQAREPRVLLEVRARVAERAGHVLDVHRIAPRRRLEAEGAERFQVPLQRHQ